ncbi:DUF5908 family protein [Motiliproteus coralliicola]|uniref:DUF5908 family protein n=1 Tax=Motiliproteus coralliicola TaxID=2283196 RepID=UPI0014031451|nr:DUF5908 family protein [Motiliproteus coralliicola]
MPILIDEVVISVQVDNRASGGSSSQPSDSETKKQIVEECVEQVLEILKQQQEP